jgi:DNA polymerase eta
VEDVDHRLPKTITIHHKHRSVAKSRQASLPLTKEFNKDFLFTHALSLWRAIEAEGRTFPTHYISIGLSGLGDVEDGVQGIQGFLVAGKGNTIRKENVPTKRKREDETGIAKFFAKTDRVKPDVDEAEVDFDDSYICSKCRTRIPIEEVDVHDDYHVALELSRESVSPVKKVSPVKSKDEKKGSKKVKTVEKGQKRLEFGR